MSTKTTSKSRTTKKAPAVQIKKDAKGRFWVVPKEDGAEQGPYATKQEALAPKAGAPKPAKESKAKRPRPRGRRSSRPSTRRPRARSR